MSVLGPAAPPVPLAANDWPADVTPPPDNLPYDDGVPLESNWHRDAMNLLIELIHYLFTGRTDFFAGGNMFIYFSAHQARNSDFRGPDVFFVKDVDGTRDRLSWVIWNEGGQFPHLIIELTSRTTTLTDHTTKKDIYERIFRTPEYFIYDPGTEQLEGWRLDEHQHYHAIAADAQGRMWSEQLNVWLGTWRGPWRAPFEHVWLRFYDTEGKLVPLFAEAERQAAQAERQTAQKEKDRANKAEDQAKLEKGRADKLEIEMARLRSLLVEQEQSLPPRDAPSATT